MSATSTSTDPVQTVIDLLSGTTAANWPSGTKPDPIEHQWDSTQRTKDNRSGVAAYVWSPDIGTQEQLSADGATKDQVETIDVDVWSADPVEANDVAGDVVAILEDYWNDKQANTEWHRIRPQSTDDRRAETLARRADHHVVSVEVQLRREDSIGT